MIELQILNRILEERSLSLLRQNNITDEYFMVYQEEYEFIKNHYEKYGVIPDKTTVLDNFPDFDVLEINESSRYLVEQMKEQYLFSQMSPFIRNLAKKTEEDSNEAFEYLKSKVDEFHKIHNNYKEGIDLIKSAPERLEKYKKRAEQDDMEGISTGIKELDNILGGWNNEGDFTSIIARTSKGKTWLLMFFLVQAWKQGKKVLLYEGEMPLDIMSYRFDTLNKHFSNTDLMRGNKLIEKDYENYIKDLKNEETPFIIIKPRDIQGRLTVSKIEGLIEKYQPDIVGIDQISLIHDELGGTQRTVRYENVTSELYQLAEKYAVPILSPHQANRDAEQDEEVEAIDEIEVPKISEIYGADAIAQNCRRVITFNKIDKMMKLSIKKNNFGKSDVDLLFIWDMDTGVINPYLQVDNSEGENKVERINHEGVDLF